MRIDETLLNEAKAFAARNGRTLNSVMEDALRQLMNRSEEIAAQQRVELPVFAGEAGYTPRVAELLAAGFSLGEIDHLMDAEERLATLERIARDDGR
ncbi:hypothetical protein [Microbispora sp. NPDC049125]|uniref:hypothetical protein n=1 Tax=Microbispora sp. NPDC049125 TaxID=3154929 RepID=UPI003466EDE2